MQSIFFDSRNNSRCTNNVIDFKLHQNILNVQGVRLDFISLPNVIENVIDVNEDLYANFPSSVGHPNDWFKLNIKSGWYVDPDSVGTEFADVMHEAETEAGVAHKFSIDYYTVANKWYMSCPDFIVNIKSEGHTSQLLEVLGFLGLTHQVVPGTNTWAQNAYDPYRNLRQVFVYADFFNTNTFEIENTIDTPWAIIPMSFSSINQQSTTFTYEELIHLHIQILQQRQTISSFKLYFFYRLDSTNLVLYPFSVREICGILTFLQ